MSKLEEEIRKYLAQNNDPFHMPGHKRIAITDSLPYDIDVTEIPSTDDLHGAEGILKEAMERTARLYHVKRTWYLVNGSTCGNLAGIFAMTHYGAEVIVARNCHISVYHAIELRGLKVHWVMPDYDEEFGIYGCVDPVKIHQLLEKYPATECVILTSPTYEGVVSDIETISQVCHENDCGLFVDEAHGAHFSVENEIGEKEQSDRFFPQSAASLGADLVVQSAHKTLPSLTMTAWLHKNTDRVSDAKIEKALRIFESSSPSYPLMISMDACTEYVLQEGKSAFQQWHENLDWFYKEIRSLRNLKVLYRKSEYFDWDSSKILINTSHTGLSGKALMDLMRERFHLECEMSSGKNVLCMTSCMDERERYQRLVDCLLSLDQEYATDQMEEQFSLLQQISSHLPETVMTIFEAVESKSEEVVLEDSIGRIAAEYVYLYPPGIPWIVPGERITEDSLKYMKELKRQNIQIRHSSVNDRNCITVVQRKKEII